MQSQTPTQSIQYTLNSSDFGISKGPGEVKLHLQNFIMQSNDLR